jgi:monovalent cation:proton antiporter-2 (CPA2) family protein
METEGLLFQAFIYLLAAVATVPIAKQFGLGSVLGYLIAGVIIGPHLLGLVGQGSGGVMHVAEFGVVMMLFLVGLEVRPDLLWRLRGPIVGTGGTQVVLTTLVVAGLASIAGISIQQALAIGMIFSASSTAIALQTLNEKGLMNSNGGRTSFSVLLFQDIAVIPILAIMPFLAVSNGGAVALSGHTDLAPWQRALLVFGTMVAIVVGGRFLIRPVFRYLAGIRLQEIFTVAALLLVVGTALAMQKVGLSPALGTFLAGVVLAESEYRHELESDIEPFKGLLLGLFFISVGASIDLPLIKSQPLLIVGLVLGLLIVKFLLLLCIGKLSKLEKSQSFTFAFALAQGGEFAFVLISFAAQNDVLDSKIGNLLVATVALSMVAAPFLFTINERFVQPRFSSRLPEREADEIDERDNPVILAGFGRFGHIVGRVLHLQGIKATVLDLDAEQVELVRKLGVKVFYGDASRLELLQAAGAAKAKLIIVAVDDEEKSLLIVETAQKHFPHLKILARAAGRDHAYRLLGVGVEHIFRETLGSSLDLSVAALRMLGFRAYEAQRAAKSFVYYDEKTVRELAKYTKDEKQYIAMAKEQIRSLNDLFEKERHRVRHSDTGWDPPKGSTSD